MPKSGQSEAFLVGSESGYVMVIELGNLRYYCWNIVTPAAYCLFSVYNFFLFIICSDAVIRLIPDQMGFSWTRFPNKATAIIKVNLALVPTLGIVTIINIIIIIIDNVVIIIIITNNINIVSSASS